MQSHVDQHSQLNNLGWGWQLALQYLSTGNTESPTVGGGLGMAINIGVPVEVVAAQVGQLACCYIGAGAVSGSCVSVCPVL